MSQTFLDVPNLLDRFQSSLVKDQVSVIEFAESKKYLGRKLYPRQKTLLKIIFLEELDDYDRKVLKEWEESDEIEICPAIEERIAYLRRIGAPHFRVVQLVGGRRSSKGFLTAIAIAYKTFLLTQMDDLSQEFGIARNKDVYFSIVASSLDQAKAYQFADANDAILDCQALLDRRLIGKTLSESISVHTPSDIRRLAELRSKGVSLDKDLASLQIRAFGTNSKTIRGSASIMFVFDEMAHLIAGESRMSDAELWKAAIPSVMQFREHGMIFANSSPYTKEGKFYEIYQQATKIWEENDPELQHPDMIGQPAFPDYFMLRFPSWALYEDWADFGMSIPPAESPEISPQMASEERSDPDAFKVEVRANFAEVIDAFLRPEMVDRMYDPAWNEEVLGFIPKPTTGAVAFTRYKGHADPASTGPANFGIAIGHLVEVKNPDTGILEQHVVFDLINAWFPEDFVNENDKDAPPTIDWLEIVPEISHLINAFRPYEFTFDQYETDMPVRELERRVREQGIDTNVFIKNYGNERNYHRARNFRTALNLGRIHAPHPDTYNPLATRNPIELSRNELKRLQETKTAHGKPKVDHVTFGAIKTKDIADCMMEVVDALIGDSLSTEHGLLTQAPAFGAQGGFSIKRGNTEQFAELADLYGQSRYGHPAHMPERGVRRKR